MRSIGEVSSLTKGIARVGGGLIGSLFGGGIGFLASLILYDARFDQLSDIGNITFVSTLVGTVFLSYLADKDQKLMWDIDDYLKPKIYNFKQNLNKKLKTVQEKINTIRSSVGKHKNKAKDQQYVRLQAVYANFEGLCLRLDDVFKKLNATEMSDDNVGSNAQNPSIINSQAGQAIKALGVDLQDELAQAQDHHRRGIRNVG